MSLEDEIKNDGLTSQMVQRIAELEDFKRKHETVQHSAGDPSSVGWVFDANTWTFSSTDAPVYVVSVNADMTGVLTLGMRVRLVHNGATKYFIIHKIGAYSGGATLITLYGGTSYTLSALAITSTYYSPDRVPFGFPAAPSNWTVSTITADTPTKAAVVAAGTWYGGTGLTPTGPSIDLPIGAWRVFYRGVGEIAITLAAIAAVGMRVTLSTANNAESDPEMTTSATVSLPIASDTQRATYTAEKEIAVAVKTTYYLNIFTGNAGATSILLNPAAVFRNVIKAVDAYL